MEREIAEAGGVGVGQGAAEGIAVPLPAELAIDVAHLTRRSEMVGLDGIDREAPGATAQDADQRVVVPDVFLDRQAAERSVFAEQVPRVVMDEVRRGRRRAAAPRHMRTVVELR